MLFNRFKKQKLEEVYVTKKSYTSEDEIVFKKHFSPTKTDYEDLYSLKTVLSMYNPSWIKSLSFKSEEIMKLNAEKTMLELKLKGKIAAKTNGYLYNNKYYIETNKIELNRHLLVIPRAEMSNKIRYLIYKIKIKDETSQMLYEELKDKVYLYKEIPKKYIKVY